MFLLLFFMYFLPLDNQFARDKMALSNFNVFPLDIFGYNAILLLKVGGGSY